MTLRQMLIVSLIASLVMLGVCEWILPQGVPDQSISQVVVIYESDLEKGASFQERQIMIGPTARKLRDLGIWRQYDINFIPDNLFRLKFLAETIDNKSWLFLMNGDEIIWEGELPKTEQELEDLIESFGILVNDISIFLNEDTSLEITPDNYKKYTGDGDKYFYWDGRKRIFNDYNYKSSIEVEGIPTISIPIIPREQWKDLIEQKNKTNSWLRSINKNVPCLDQGSLGYCHAYGTIGAGMTMRASMGLPFVWLSAESVGGLVTGWQNDGADPREDLRVFKEYGACDISFMDRPWSLSPSRWRNGWQEDALNHTSVKCAILTQRDLFGQLMTCVLNDVPSGTWFTSWWMHHVQGPLQAKYENGKFWLLYRNSWGPTYGDDGYFWMAEGKGRGLATPDGAFIILSMKPSEE